MKRIMAVLLAIVLLFTILPPPAVRAAETEEISAGGALGGLGVVCAEDIALAPGVVETVFTVNAADGSAQNQMHLLTVDPSEPTVSLRAVCPENDPFPWTVRRTSKQAQTLETALRETDPTATVVAGVNANYFNMSTGEPRGAVVCGGVRRHDTESGSNYFCIKTDGSAVIRAGSSKIPAAAQETVAGEAFIIRKGKLVENTSKYAVTRNPRTVVGLREDGTILLLQTDGRQSPTSVGMTLEQIGTFLLALGCTEALNLDGGGSTTFLSRRPGEALTVKNSPSDGYERPVSASLMVVSTDPARLTDETASCAHDWTLEGDAAVCALCGQTRPTDTFTGLYRDGETQRCRILGRDQRGWIAWDEGLLHLSDDGAVHAVTICDERTCTENGALAAVCSDCGASFSGTSRYRTGHRWDENHICTVCGTAGTDIGTLQTGGVSKRYTYRGSSVCPYPKFTDSGRELEIKTGVNGRDGAAMWYCADTLGPAMVEVEGRGDYYGCVRMTYEIVLAPVNGAAVSHEEGTRLYLSWEEVPGAQEYRVYRRDGAEEREIARVAAPADGLLIEGLTPDTTYTLCVRAATEADGVWYESYGQTWLTASTTRDDDRENSPSARAITRFAVELPDASVSPQRAEPGETLFLPAFADLSALPLVIETVSGAAVTLSGVKGSVTYVPGEPVNCASLFGASASGANWLDVSVGGEAPWRVWVVQGVRISLFLSGADGFDLRSTAGKLRCSAAVGGMIALTDTPKRGTIFTLPEAKSLYSDAPASRVWLLDAMPDDPTMLENKLFFRLGSRLNAPGAATAAWVDVYQDGVYCGLFQFFPALPQAEGADVDALCASLRAGSAADLDLDELAMAWLLLQYRDDDRALCFYRDEDGALHPAPDWTGVLKPDESLLAALSRLPGLSERADALRESTLRPEVEKMLRAGGTMDTYIDRAEQSAVMDRLLRGAGDAAARRADAEALRADLLLRLDPSASMQRKNPFTDVAVGQYYHDPVLWAVRHMPRITNGTSATTFSPNAPCTRAQAVTFLWRLNGCMEPKSTANPFRDVNSSDYFCKAVLWAAEQGITDGTSDTTFSPNAPCTRGQIVTFLWRAAGRSAASGANPFRDVRSTDYYFQPVLWAAEKGVTDGVTASTFAPGQTCTRGQIVTFLCRADAVK